MTCKNCKKNFNIDELDGDCFCYDCANLDLDYNLDTAELIKGLMETTINKLAAAKGSSASNIKDELVSEYIHKNPDKYIERVIARATKKKSDIGGN